MRGWGLGLLQLIALGAILGVLFQTTVFHDLPLDLVVPDVLLILCVYVGLHRHSLGGSMTAFLLGYFSDSFSGEALGLHAFSLTLVFLFVYLVSRRVWTDNVVANVAIVFFAALVKGVTVSVLLAFYLEVDFPWSSFLGLLWLEAIVAALLSPLVFSLLDGGRRLWGAEA